MKLPLIKKQAIFSVFAHSLNKQFGITYYVAGAVLIAKDLEMNFKWRTQDIEFLRQINEKLLNITVDTEVQIYK